MLYAFLFYAHYCTLCVFSFSFFFFSFYCMCFVICCRHGEIKFIYKFQEKHCCTKYELAQVWIKLLFHDPGSIISECNISTKFTVGDHWFSGMPHFYFYTVKQSGTKSKPRNCATLTLTLSFDLLTYWPTLTYWTESWHTGYSCHAERSHWFCFFLRFLCSR